MQRLLSHLNRPLTSADLDLRLARVACFVSAPLLFVLALRGVSRWAGTPGEILLGVLLTSAVSLLFVILGCVLPRPERRAEV